MHPQTLRIYESRGLITPKRSPKMTRLYSNSDVERLRRIQELTSKFGMNLAGVVDRKDMGVLEASRDLDLAEESLRAEAGGELGVEHLEGHGAIVAEIERPEHRGHPAAAELALENVTGRQGGLQRGVDVRQRNARKELCAILQRG